MNAKKFLGRFHRSERGGGELGFVVILVVLFGLAALVLQGIMNKPTDFRDNYRTDPNNPCFVPPQSDPLYDAHYADINKKNCEAWMKQEQGKQVDEVTQGIRQDNQHEQVGFTLSMGSIVFVAGSLFLLGLVMLLRK